MLIRFLTVVFVCILSSVAFAQETVSAPDPQPARIVGTVLDSGGAAIPNAVVTLGTASINERRREISDSNGYFAFSAVQSATEVQINITADGFEQWSSPTLTLTPGQYFELTDIKLTVGSVNTTVTAIFPEQLALEQVKAEEKQRVLGIVPNFYISYDPSAVPLTKMLKFRLALKASTDVVTFSAVGAMAGINQAAGRFHFGNDAAAYGQRLGTVYADGVTDIFIGGAILPSLLHQDPRYFYQGTGTTQSRIMHALSTPFICKGDNGKLQFNYSTIGGDLASGALSNLYYPSADRGAGLVVQTALVAAGARAVTALAQEFILKRFTTNSKKDQRTIGSQTRIPKPVGANQVLKQSGERRRSRKRAFGNLRFSAKIIAIQSATAPPS